MPLVWPNFRSVLVLAGQTSPTQDLWAALLYPEIPPALLNAFLKRESRSLAACDLLVPCPRLSFNAFLEAWAKGNWLSGPASRPSKR
jgi:hypothetical protein